MANETVKNQGMAPVAEGIRGLAYRRRSLNRKRWWRFSAVVGRCASGTPLAFEAGVALTGLSSISGAGIPGAYATWLLYVAPPELKIDSYPGLWARGSAVVIFGCEVPEAYATWLLYVAPPELEAKTQAKSTYYSWANSRSDMKRETPSSAS